MDINKQLYNIYSETNEKVYKYITEKNKQPGVIQVVYPFFLKVPEKFINTKNKIIVYGQEPFGWSDVNNNESNVYCMENNNIDGIIECYDLFFNKNDGCNNIHSPFWNVFRLTKDYFYEYAQYSNKEFGYLWNNISKLGLDGTGFPYTWYDDVIKPYFNNIIKSEIEIIKPDFIIFYTGKSRGFLIDEIFNKPERKTVEGFEQNEICEFIIPNVKKALRTEHPNTLYMNSSNGSYKEIIRKIVHEIETEME